MLLQNLNVENFGSIRNASLDFTKGFNVLSGDIGQGKSHIIYSIAFLLLNTVKKRRIDNYLNWDADSFKAEVFFEHLEKKFHIRSLFENGTVDRYLKYGNVTVTGSSDVTSTLSDMFDPSLYKAAMISFQDEADIVSATASTRRDNFRKIYDLEFDAQIQELEQLAKNLKDGKLKDLVNNILILENKEYEYHRLKRLPLSDEELQSLQESRDEYLSKIVSIKADIASYEKQVEKKAALEKEFSSVKKAITDLIAKKESTLQEITTKKDDLSTKDWDASIKKTEEQLSQNFEETLQKLQKDLDQIVQKREGVVVLDFDYDIDAKIDELQKLIIDKQVDVNGYQKQLDIARTGKCPECGRDYDGVDISEMEKTCHFMIDDLNKLKEDLSKETQHKEMHDSAVKEKESYKQQEDLLKEKIKNEKASIEAKKQQIQNRIEMERVAVQNKKDTLASEIERLEERMNGVEQHLASSENRAKQIAVEVSDMDLPDAKPVLPKSLVDSLSECEEKIDSYNQIKTSNELLKQQNEKTKKIEEKDIENLEVYRKERFNLMQEVELWERGVVILKKEFPNYVINRTLGDIEAHTNEFLDMAYGGRYHISIQENKSGIDILYGPKKKDIALASGGEQDLFNLGLKHAFCKITGLGVLVLDEVDKFMSPSMSKHVFSLLNDMLIDPENDIDQVIVVTHNAETKEMLMVDFEANTYHIQDGQVIKE